MFFILFFSRGGNLPAVKQTTLGRNAVVNLRGFIEGKPHLFALESSEEVFNYMQLEEVVEDSEKDDAESEDVVG